MAIKAREILKSYFGKGMYPTARQFADLIDSFRHRSEHIALDEVNGLADVLNRKGDAGEMEALRQEVETLESTGTATRRGRPVYMIDVLIRVPAGTEQPELPTPEEFGAQGGEIVVAVDYDGLVRFSGIVLPADSGDGYIIRELPLTMTREEISAGKWPGLESDRRLVRRATSYYLRGGGIYAGTSWYDSDFAAAFVANEEGALSCLSSMAALKELQERLFAFEARCEEEIPTPQVTSEGDESQYVYSVADGNDARCVMTLRNTQVVQKDGQLMLRCGKWSVASESGMFHTKPIPVVDTGSDGAMSKNVFYRLGTGASIYEGTPTATTVPISYPNWASGGSRTFTLRAATSARAGLMTAAQFNKFKEMAEDIETLKAAVAELQLNGKLLI